MTVESLITQHIDTWTSAVKTKSTTGRGSSKKLELYGVKKLRELILELAFSGKLVKNDPQKVTLDSLLDEMYRERVEFHERKGVRLQKFKELPDTKLSFSLPNSWEVVAFNDVITYITDFQANGSFSTIKQNVQYFDNPDYAMLLRLTDLRHGLTDSSSYKYTDKKGYDFLSKSSVHGGELVVANVGAGVGTTLEVPQIEMPTTLAPNMFMVVLSKQVEKSYFLYFCQSLKYKQYIEMVNTGTGQPKINKTEYKNCQLPLPSLQEQNQVVAKINQLMALCDQLEQQTEASIEAHQLLVSTLLNTLTNSADADELMDNWARISDHFDTLFTTEESIDQLKQTILQLAVMGKLVPQDPNDEPASILLERIAEEKAQLIKKKKIKKQKALPPITDDEKPFDLPNGWEWARLSDIANVIDPNPSHRMPKYVESGIPFISTENFTLDESINFDIGKKVTTAVLNDQVSKFDLSEGAFAMSRIGTIGKTRFLPIERNYCMSHALCVISPLVKLIDHQYLKFVVSAESSLSQAHHGVKSIGVPDLGMGVIRSFLIPIPPKTKQELIVINVESLLTICENLKNRLKESQITQLHLTDAIVEQAV
ncbi:restriction endonuclease subunit S [Photobacterium leiognathi]|uniref:restriction endonuclease subunit S n=1 Tax=Photobacterium leiognathi TaxID=553611 RepID=UPI000D16C30F|nr:restriction endonuclease subunit S [Photobacterium leiognathi]PSW58040.1 restriction endonuclease subunit S [Photobacterium leiognathi subsp. mandapamensis]